MIDAPPLWSLLFDHLQAGASKRAQSGGLGIGQSLVTNVVVGRLTDAFRPLACTAEVYDFETQLRYRVFGPSGTAVVSALGIPLSRLFAREALDAEIDKTRAALEREGLVLDARPA